MADKQTQSIRCRRLGHEVPLDYCCRQEGETICPLIRNCWWEFMDIDDYLRQHLPEVDYHKLLQTPTPAEPRLTKLIAEALKATAAEHSAKGQD